MTMATFWPLALRSKGTISVPKLTPVWDCGLARSCAPPKSLNSVLLARSAWYHQAVKNGSRKR